jgi:hypothetical protein
VAGRRRRQLLQDGGDGRAAARRHDRVPAELGDADVWIWWGTVEREGGDHLVVAQPLDGEPGRDFAGQQAEGDVELVSGQEAEHVGLPRRAISSSTRSPAGQE